MRIETISDFQKLIGTKVVVDAKSNKEYLTGIVKNISDDGKYLILIKTEKISIINKVKRMFSIKKAKGDTLECNILISDISLIEVVDRFLKE